MTTVSLTVPVCISRSKKLCLYSLKLYRMSFFGAYLYEPLRGFTLQYRKTRTSHFTCLELCSYHEERWYWAESCLSFGKRPDGVDASPYHLSRRTPAFWSQNLTVMVFSFVDLWLLSVFSIICYFDHLIVLSCVVFVIVLGYFLFFILVIFCRLCFVFSLSSVLKLPLQLMLNVSVWHLGPHLVAHTTNPRSISERRKSIIGPV